MSDHLILVSRHRMSEWFEYWSTLLKQLVLKPLLFVSEFFLQLALNTQGNTQQWNNPKHHKWHIPCRISQKDIIVPETNRARYWQDGFMKTATRSPKTYCIRNDEYQENTQWKTIGMHQALIHCTNQLNLQRHKISFSSHNYIKIFQEELKPDNLKTHSMINDCYRGAKKYKYTKRQTAVEQCRHVRYICKELPSVTILTVY